MTPLTAGIVGAATASLGLGLIFAWFVRWVRRRIKALEVSWADPEAIARIYRANVREAYRAGLEDRPPDPDVIRDPLTGDPVAPVRIGHYDGTNITVEERDGPVPSIQLEAFVQRAQRDLEADADLQDGHIYHDGNGHVISIADRNAVELDPDLETDLPTGPAADRPRDLWADTPIGLGLTLERPPRDAWDTGLLNWLATTWDGSSRRTP